MPDTKPTPAADNLFKYFCATEVREVNHAKRTIVHRISTPRFDRAGDMIEPMGWELDDFRSGGAVLADHDYSIEKIIGVNLALHKSEDGLDAVTQFDDEGLGAEAFRKATSTPPMLRAWSVGFRSLARHWIEAGRDAGCERCAKTMKGMSDGTFAGIHFTRQELLEYSAVAVPANPDAVMSLVQRGVVIGAEGFVRDMRSAAGPAQAAPDGATVPAGVQVNRGDDRYRALLAVADRQRRLARGAMWRAMEKGNA